MSSSNHSVAVCQTIPDKFTQAINLLVKIPQCDKWINLTGECRFAFVSFLIKTDLHGYNLTIY